MRVQLFLSISLVLSLMACQQPTENASVEKKESKPDRATLKKHFQSLEDTLSMAYNNKDVDLFKRFYAEDAVTYGEGREQLFGLRELESHFMNNVVKDSSKLQFSYSCIDVFHEDDLAVETGKWIERSPEGKELDHGFYMVVFEKQENGRWKSIRDMWNTSTPDGPSSANSQE
ncbi:MAG: nuclear transport factor 2 family protein [Owenweeksia sp.]|nr:nuclear transport factor 2 family protein [Owenweeksia sp.]